ncbi:MAG: YfcE family phosphodiesterase [Chloroflexota bacterium]|nr:YfcE family phosphodiesterase [Chloroflexota bacterium]
MESSSSWRRFLPAELRPERVVAVVGLVSDTHLPERCAALPEALFGVLAGAELILHAGDVGELRVLDALSAIAPVVAVHGNDDTTEAQRELPYQQVVMVAGQRIVLCHTHHPDRAQELALRQGDAWEPKLAQRSALGERAGATIVVWGHAHIPLACRQGGVLLVNPGAIASPNAVTRQACRTVGLLFFRDDGVPFPVHVDLAAPGGPFDPQIDLEAGFRAASERFTASILAPDLQERWPELQTRIGAVAPEAFRAAILRAARPCWSGERKAVTRADLRTALQEEEGLSGEARVLIEAL